MKGIKTRLKTYSGMIKLQNRLKREATVQVVETRLVGSHLAVFTVKPGDEFNFEPGENKQFDFLFVVNQGAARSHVLRGATYQLVESSPPDSGVCIEIVSLPEREKSDRLASVKGLSISMSASGWLVIYQLGAAACLMNHGIHRNPYARVSGASGGALTVSIMMYGANPAEVRDKLIECAERVHGDWSNNFSLRAFNLEAMEGIVKDGSFQHPAFADKRVEIAITTSVSKLPGFFVKMGLTGSEERCTDFETSSDIVIALLASSTCGVSGLPFSMEDKDGNAKVVADGAFKNFLPVIDEFSIKVKPLCDGLGMAMGGLVSGGTADIGPTEYIATGLGLFPPPTTMLQHLYELGYQDTQAWIESKLEDRLVQLAEAKVGEDLPTRSEVSWACANDGMLWYDDVLEKVPFSWADQLRHSMWKKTSSEKSAAPPLSEGLLTLEALRFYHHDEGKPVLKNEIKLSRELWLTLSKVDLQWCPGDQRDSQASPMDEDQVETMMRGLLASGFFGADQETALQRAKQGRLHLTWLNHVDIDREFADTLHVKTANYCVSLKAASPAVAVQWRDAIAKALFDLQRSLTEDPASFCRGTGAEADQRV